MSQEAIGENGAAIAKKEYYQKLNNEFLLNAEALKEGGYTYHASIVKFGDDILKPVLTDILLDVTKKAKYLQFMPQDNRKRLVSFLKGLESLARMTGNYCAGLASNAKEFAELKDSKAKPASGQSLSTIEQGRYEYDHYSGKKSISDSDKFKIISYASAYGVDKGMKEYPNEAPLIKTVAMGKDKYFLQDVIYCIEYHKRISDYYGACGYGIGSGSYINYFEKKLFTGSTSSVRDYDYVSVIKSQLSKIKDIILKDAENAIANENYILDKFGDHILISLDHLSSCGVSNIETVKQKVAASCWYVGGDPLKIRSLQIKLNQLNYLSPVLEDGVYSKSLDAQVIAFNQALGADHCVKIVQFTRDWDDQLLYGDYIVDKVNIPVTAVDQAVEAYNLVKASQFKGTIPPEIKGALDMMAGKAGYIKAGGNIVLASYLIVDIVQLINVIEDDLKDADKKLGRNTERTVISILGSWVGYKLGLIAGKVVGGLIMSGGGVFVVVGAITGAVCGLVLSIEGSYYGGQLPNLVIDCTDVYPTLPV